MASRTLLLVTDLSGRRHPGAGRRPWSWLLSLLGVVLLADLVLALSGPAQPLEPVLADDLPRARAALQRARAHDDGWLLLGDSVLAGDVMRGVVPDWSEHRVLDYMRHEQATRSVSTVGFEQIALDGMLPVDMLQIVRELDALDPEAHVGLVLEINPRYFSTHYTKQRECTRDYLCQMGRLPSKGWTLAWTGKMWTEMNRWLQGHLPVVRHRDRFMRWGSEPPETLLPRLEEAAGDDPTEDPLIARARVLEHYRELVISRRSIQLRALRVIIDRLRQRGRRALIFATPLNDDMMAGTLDDWRYGHAIATLDEVINRPDDTAVRFISLDHPRVRPPMFIDHAHLRPEGNRWLAVNLLHQLGVRLARLPAPGTLAYEEGPDRSLLAHIDRGFGEGAPWQAFLNHPDGIDVTPGGGRLVMADTDSHIVAQMVTPRTALRRLAGVPGSPGHKDGRRHQAQFESPRRPVILDGRVYVADGKRRERLRVIDGDQVRTLEPTGGERWTRIDRMRSDGRRLWLLDRGTRLLRVDPQTGATSLALDSLLGFRAFDIGPDGRLYLADGKARVWQWSPGDPEPTLLFANNAHRLLPQGRGETFPFDFDQIALVDIVDLRYVDRYDALLVQDQHGDPSNSSAVSERVHLRLLSPRERKVYPWVHPLAHGGGHIFLNEHTGTLASNMHRGSMALDPQTATLFYLERDRSRLLALGDGLWGTAKLGHHITPTAYGGLRDVFGLNAGQSTMLEHHPERWAHRRLEPVPRRGPYVGLMLGSSMTSLSEVVGQYSMARVMERSLTRALGVKDGLRFDLVQRAYRGPRLATLVSGFEQFIEHQSPADVVFFEVHSGRMFSKYDRQGAMIDAVDRIRRTAERYDTLVVVIDNDAMPAHKRDGLRTTSTRVREFLELCEGAGFTVIRPGDLLLREALDHAPWGTAPFSGTHGSTWAMDLTAQTSAELAYPHLREHLAGRTPVLRRPRAAAVEQAAPLYRAFEQAPDVWADKTSKRPADALQRHMDRGRLELLVDLGKAGIDGKPTATLRDALVLDYLVLALLRDPAGRLASEVTIGLARFDNYDEYGVGVLEGASIVDRRQLDRAALDAFLVRMGGDGDGAREADDR